MQEAIDSEGMDMATRQFPALTNPNRVRWMHGACWVHRSACLCHGVQIKRVVTIQREPQLLPVQEKRRKEALRNI